MRFLFVFLLSFKLTFTIAGVNYGVHIRIESGEKLHYTSEQVKLAIELEKDVLSSKVIHLVIQDSLQNDVVNKLFVVQTGREVRKFFTVPENIKSGTYLLRCFMLEDGEALEILLSEFYVINTKSFSDNDIDITNSKIMYQEANRKTFGNPVQISGRISGLENVDEQVVCLQSRGISNIFKYTLTNKNGEFDFYDSLYGVNEIFIDMLTRDKKKYILELTKFSYSIIQDNDDFSPYKLPQKVLEDIDRLKAIIIEMNYSITTVDSVVKYSSPLVFNRHIVLEEYAKLPTVVETIYELVPLKKIKKKKDKYELFLLNDADNSFHKKEPLFLVDGFMVKDFNRILDLKRAEIQSIRTSYKLKNNMSAIGRLANYGVFEITTFNNNFIPDSGIYLKVVGFE